MKVYPLEQYDKHFALKVTVTTKLVLVFLLKSYMILLVDLYLQTKSIQLIRTLYTSANIFAASIIATLPAILAAIALTRRTPEAGQFTRTLWSKSGILLTLSAIAVTAIDIYNILSKYNPAQAQISQVVMVILGAYCCFYLLTSKRFKATFESFPEEH